MLFMLLVLYFYTVKDTYLNTMKILYMHNTEILTCNWLGADIEEKSPAPKCPFLFWIMQTYIKTGNLINSSYSVIQVSLSNCKDVRFILIFFCRKWNLIIMEWTTTFSTWRSHLSSQKLDKMKALNKSCFPNTLERDKLLVTSTQVSLH